MGAPSGLGLWIWQHWKASGGRVDDIIACCQKSGVTWLAIKAADRNSRWFRATAQRGHWTLDVARANFRALRAANIGVYTWHYSTPASYSGELEIMRELLGYEVDGHIVDAEVEWEGHAREARAFAAGITKLRTELNAWIAHAPFYKPSAHATFPYRELGAACDAVMPQAYWTARRGGVDEVTKVVDDETSDFHAPSDDAVGPIGITYGKDSSPDEAVIKFRADDLRAFLAQYRAKPFVSLWTYDSADPELWPALESLAADAAAPAAGNGLAVIDPGGAGALSHDLAARVNAHLSRAMRTVLVPAGSLEQRAAHVQRLKANLVLSVNAAAQSRDGVARSEVWTHTRSSDASRRFGHAIGRELRAVPRSADLVMLRPETVGGGAAACLVDVSVGDRRALDATARTIARAVQELGPRRGRGARFGAPVGDGRSDLHCAVLEPHGGPRNNAILRWNVEAPASTVDVVLHLHGYSAAQRNMRLTEKEEISGLDFYGDPDHQAVPPRRTRARNTVGILPRGQYTGDGQHRNRHGDMVDNDRRQYTFGALVRARKNLDDLVACGLGELSAQTASSATRDRLVLTAHSGGGAPLLQLMGLGHDPSEVHVFDGLYGGDVGPLVSWALRHLRADASAISGLSDDDAVAYMQSSGGALRIFYISGAGTEDLSVQVHGVLACALATLSPGQRGILSRYYRAQSVGRDGADHLTLPRKLGWQLLEDAGADVAWKGAALTHRPAEPKSCRKALQPYTDWVAVNDDGTADDATDPSSQIELVDAGDTPNPGDGVSAYGARFPRKFGAADSYARAASRTETRRGRGSRFGAVTAGRQELYAPLLHAHWPHTGTPGVFGASTGSETNVILLWNDVPTSSLSSIDVVVHFHGWRHPSLTEANQFTGTAPHQKELVSGVDLHGRTRPTLAILVRGQQGKGGATSMSFPALAGSNLQALIGDCLDWFATSQLGQSAGSLAVCRLVLTGHSGGGAPLQTFVGAYDPDEAHIHDALYGDANGVVQLAGWVKDRISRDIAALSGLAAQAARDAYMSSQGGACRVFYLPDDTTGTGRRSKALHQEIVCAIGAASDPAVIALLTSYYRVQIATTKASVVVHEDIPAHYEPSLLSSGAGVDIAPAYDPPAASCPVPARSGYPSVTRRAACAPASPPSGASPDAGAPSDAGSYFSPDGGTPYADPGDAGAYPIAGAPLGYETEALYGEPYPRVLDGDAPQQWEARIADAEAKVGAGMFRHLTQKDLDDLVAARADFDPPTHDDQVRRLQAVLAAVRAWILDTSQSAILQLSDASLRRHFTRGVDWARQNFPGSKKGPPQDEAAALFDAMATVVAERRITQGGTRLVYHDVSGRLKRVPQSDGKKLFDEAADAFVMLRDGAAPEGIALTILSAYRSEERQREIRATHDNPSAVAQGRSAHTYGLAVDLALSVRGLDISETYTGSMPNMVSMYASPVYKWMLVNGERFGFFPYKKEPWHWEYNPPGFASRYAAVSSAQWAHP